MGDNGIPSVKSALPMPSALALFCIYCSSGSWGAQHNVHCAVHILQAERGGKTRRTVLKPKGREEEEEARKDERSSSSEQG